MVFRAGSLRFHFYAFEEARRHVHVWCQGRSAKFWIEPEVELAWNHGLKGQEVARARRLIRDRRNEIIEAWEAFHGPPGHPDHR